MTAFGSFAEGAKTIFRNRSPARNGAGIVLCADDYGLAPGIGVAIRHLLQDGRLSATGCMSVSPHWEAEGAALAALCDHADIGLHLTLTDQKPLGKMPSLAPQGRFPTLQRLSMRAYTRQLDRGEIAAEIERQIDRFIAVIGRPPAFIDGHQHVHVLPIVRDLVIEMIERRRVPAGTYLRFCDEPVPGIVRRGVAVMPATAISLMARGLRRRARRDGLAGNRGFRGVRTFREPAARPLFQAFFKGAGPGLLVMCHPGLVDSALVAADPLTRPREEEYRYLAGDGFLQDLGEAGLRLGRFEAIEPGTR
jgi:predicted glycoside hydrolase/deacetylase ChbG (UPF0249 family)